MNSKSFQLHKLNDDTYQVFMRKSNICDAQDIQNNVEEFKGRLENLKNWLVLKDISRDEIDLAVSEFSKNNHNSAEFGVFGTFIYSRQDDSISKIEKKEGNVIFVKF